MEPTPPAPPLFMVEVRVGDLARSLAWYAAALRLPVRLLDEGNGFALLGDAPAHIALKADADPLTDRRTTRLAFRIEDVDAERSRLAGLGVPASEPIANEREGYREIRLDDPDGTPITLFAWDRSV